VKNKTRDNADDRNESFERNRMATVPGRVDPSALTLSAFHFDRFPPKR